MGRRGHRPWSGAIASALALFLLASNVVGAAPRPVFFSDTSTPTNTIVSYFNAINRGEYSRAYGYLVGQSRPLFGRWEQAAQNTAAVQVVAMKLLGYTDASIVHAEMCVGVHLTVIDRLGHRMGYHGWYLLEAMSGEEPDFRDWHIDLPDSRIFRDHRKIRLLQEARCRIV